METDVLQFLRETERAAVCDPAFPRDGRINVIPYKPGVWWVEYRGDHAGCARVLHPLMRAQGLTPRRTVRYPDYIREVWD